MINLNSIFLTQLCNSNKNFTCLLINVSNMGYCRFLAATIFPMRLPSLIFLFIYLFLFFCFADRPHIRYKLRYATTHTHLQAGVTAIVKYEYIRTCIYYITTHQLDNGICCFCWLLLFFFA